MRALYAAAGLFALACGVEPALDDLRCSQADDLTCPTGFWCQRWNESISQCVDASKTPPPDLAFDGVGTQKGSYGPSVQVPAGKLTLLQAQLTNRSRAEAFRPDVTFTGPKCLHVDSGLRIVDSIGPLRAYQDDFYVHPEAGCPSPAAVQVELVLHGKRFAGSFQVTF